MKDIVDLSVNETLTRGITPIYELEYVDSRVQGTYIDEVFFRDAENKIYKGQGSRGLVRQKFQYKSDTVSHYASFNYIKARLLQKNIPNNGDTAALKARLLDENGFELRHAYFNINNRSNEHKWELARWKNKDYEFEPAELENGKTYYIELGMPLAGAESYEIIALRDGSKQRDPGKAIQKANECNGYPETFDNRLSDFEIGHAEYFDSAESTPKWKVWEVTGYDCPRLDAVLPIYLTN